MAESIDKTLADRGAKYGSFDSHAHITQSLKRVFMEDPQKWHKLSDDKKEALEMVAHKIGRILNGDPEYIDSWHDIIGYTRLVETKLIEVENDARRESERTAQAPAERTPRVLAHARTKRTRKSRA